MNLFKPSHIIFLLIVIVLLFGYKRLPDIARSLGQSMKVIKKEVKELRDEDDQKPAAQIQQPQEGTYYTEPTQDGQAASQSTEGSAQK